MLRPILGENSCGRSNYFEVNWTTAALALRVAKRSGSTIRADPLSFDFTISNSSRNLAAQHILTQPLLS
jgi:hypothetical protein